MQDQTTRDFTLDDMLANYNILVDRIAPLEKEPIVADYIKALDMIRELEDGIKQYTKNERTVSYQTEFWNVERQERRTITYDPAKMRDAIPQFADAVIEETVNKKKIDGLLKGDLITADQIQAAQNESIVIAVSIKRTGKLKV